jgi:hypothetical protein
MVLGVKPKPSGDVVQKGAWFAARMGASLVCLQTDESHLVIWCNEDGTVSATSMNPGAVDDVNRLNATDRHP